MDRSVSIKAFDETAKMISGTLSETLLRLPANKKPYIQEIRLRSGRAVALTEGNETIFMCRDGTVLYTPTERAVICSRQDIHDTFKSICGYSVYSRQSEINNGYITAPNGSRIGICGTANLKNGEITSITDITTMNIRISRQIFGAADEIIKRLFPLRNGILIAGPPTSGKTTILRDIAYNISLGKSTGIKRTCIIDERGEISGGINGNIDTGLSDVLVGYPKSLGIIQAIRSLSPQVMICDEVGTSEDVRTVLQGANAGVYIIATIHSDSFESLMKRKQGRELLASGAFGNVVVLDNESGAGRIKEWIDTEMLPA